jgi:hypothetical protein
MTANPVPFFPPGSKFNCMIQHDFCVILEVGAVANKNFDSMLSIIWWVEFLSGNFEFK